MNVQSYITQRLRSTIWYSLDNDLLENAEFTAERLLGVSNKNDSESIYLYGLVLYRRGKYKAAYRQTANHIHVGCAFIFAKSALKLELQSEGIYALQQTMHLWNKNELDVDESGNSSNLLGLEAFSSAAAANYEHGRRSTPDAAVLFSLLGKLYASIGDVKESSVYHAQALKLNPYLWDSFEQLCNMGVNVNTKSVYKPKTGIKNHLSYAAIPTNSNNSNNNNNNNNKSRSSAGGLAPINPKTFFSRSSNVSQDDIGHDISSSSIKHDNGHSNSNHNNSTSSVYSTPRPKQSVLPDAPIRRPIRHSANNSSNDITDSIQRRGPRQTASKVASRLITQSTPTVNSSINFNKSSAVTASGDLNLKRGKNSSKLSNSNILSGSNSLDLRKKEYSDQAEFRLMTLYSIFARGLKAMTRYDCYKAIRILNQLPDSQIETPWVLGKLGRLNFEIVNYEQAEQYFIRLRKLDRTRVEDMEYYSTLLWHLHKDVELSFLSHELYEINKTCPQTWVTIGNLFSLQRETDEAIRCFQRATQVDVKFAYAYTLQGHEYVANDAYENALESFRNALLYDSKHYNALYGIGMVYLKLGEFTKAEYHFRKARDINPVNVILICCVGMVLEKLDKKELALKQYELANELQPLSPLALFKKAQLLFALQNIQQSLAEFEKLKIIAPDEASVHFLLGQLYRITNRKSEAIKEFTIALNLDPKGSHLIKDALESLNDE